MLWEAMTNIIDNYISAFSAFDLFEEDPIRLSESIDNRAELFKYLLDDLEWIYSISKLEENEEIEKEILELIKYINKETSEMLDK